jgi:hypothetical protein
LKAVIDLSIKTSFSSILFAEANIKCQLTKAKWTSSYFRSTMLKNSGNFLLLICLQNTRRKKDFGVIAFLLLLEMDQFFSDWSDWILDLQEVLCLG